MLLWECSETVYVHAGARHVWAVWSAAQKWPVWNTQMKRVAFWGALQVGTKGVMQPLDGAELQIEITRVRPGKMFTLQAKHQLTIMEFTHIYHAAKDGQPARITHEVKFNGVLAPWLGSTIGKTIKNNLRQVLLNLSAQAQMLEQAANERQKRAAQQAAKNRAGRHSRHFGPTTQFH